MNEPVTTRRAIPDRVAAALIALAAILPFLPTLRAGFIYDDTTIVRDNALLRGWSALARVWSAPYWPTFGNDVGLYRPLHVALLAALWNLGGGSPRLFHVYAIALHLIVAVVLWRLLGAAVGRVAAIVGALWFATHALHVETVASVANSSELLVALFTMALAAVIVRAERVAGTAREWAMALLAGALTVAAVYSKESGLLALPVAAVTAWGWRRASDAPAVRTMVRRQARLWVVCIAALVVALIERAVVLGAAVAPAAIVAPGLDVMTARVRIVAMLSLWPRIAGMLVWPTSSLSPYYGPTILPEARAVRAVIAVLAALALIALAIVAARRGDRRPLVAATWIALTYLPASNLITSVGLFLADRTLLGPTVGVALAVAWAIDVASPRLRPVLAIASAVVIAHSAWVGLRYSVVWSSHRTLWERLVETSPTEYRGYQLLGIDAREHGDTARALPLLARAFAMEPRDRRVRFEYGQVLYSTARYAEAAAVLAPLLRDGDVRREPEFVALYLEAVGRSRGAEGVVAAGTPLLRSESAAVAALYVGVAEEQLGRFAAADSAYGVGLRAQPSDTILQARRAALERRAAPR
ncbi:MAG: tetratricopeptide repeat protein [Gemmatimonadetes bacterium]|nr:tetratricopeptide repeat protein [Gemmatimonadota bacterium]